MKSALFKRQPRDKTCHPFLSIIVLIASLLTLPALNACKTLAIDTTSSPSPIGQIWDTQAQRVVSQETLLQRAAEARYVLLGEVHDNEEHHRIQASILKALIAKNVGPTLAMEQFDIEHQAAIDNSLKAADVNANAVAEAGRFDRNGWDWPFYEPIIVAALEGKAPIAAINLSRSASRKFMNEGIQALGNARIAELALNAVWNETRNETLRREIIDGHCGSVPDGLLPKLLAAQRARDATMADIMITRGTANAVVATLGLGHARKDIGAPIYLAKRMPAASVLSLGLIEVDPNNDQVLDTSLKDLALRFDYVWFTSMAARKDPCKEFSLPTPRS